jgi:RHS repeat-associated protein
LLYQQAWVPNYNGCSESTMAPVTADANNHISVFAYDASGNATNDGAFAYTWDAESQMKTAAGVTYTYDGDGRRVSKSNGKIYWYGSGGDILAETDAAGNTLNEYIFFGGNRVAMLPSGSSPLYYAEDFLGSSRVITSSTGVPCYDADFDPFGGEHPYINTCPQNYKFEGKERDTETGNDDFGARYYTERFGRWLSADWSAVPVPVPYANLTNPQTLNLYSMVADDPESFADLDGHCCWDWIKQQAKSFEVGVAKELHNEALAQPLSATLKEVNGLSDIAGNSPPPETANNASEALGMVTTVVAPLALGAFGGEEDPVSNIRVNAEKGASFEQSVVEATKATDTNVQQQVTLKTDSGVKTKMDVVSTKPSGGVRLQEAKSSGRARLTTNQAAAHPEIEKSGATVVGQGKPGYPGGTRIPPTKVEVVRPTQED